MQACESENLVALLEPRYISACRFYFSRQLLAENLPSWRSDAEPNSEKKLPFERKFETAQLAVPHGYRRGVGPHYNLVVLWRRLLLYIPEFYSISGSILVANDRLLTRSLPGLR